jgi:release factor glutamine methyltransferase
LGLSIDTALQEASAQFKSVDPHTAGMDARLLMMHVMDYDLAKLLLYKKQELTADQETQWYDYVAQRLTHKPVAKITGYKEFYGASFRTTEHTLDPRPDSEILIETIQNHYRDTHTPLRILDMGTGTGCLLLTLLRLYPQATGLGVDLSTDTLQVAQNNAYDHRLLERADFIQSSWYERVHGTFDLIISNPPYIVRDVLPRLDKSVTQFDPMLALDGGIDGLDPYRIIIPQAHAFLKPKGCVCVEIGYDQEDAVSNLLAENGFQSVTTTHDLGGNPRIVKGHQNI